mgnify:CR=1 FL=1
MMNRSTRTACLLLPLVSEYLPKEVYEAAGVPPIGEALRMVHRPRSIAEARAGRARKRV